jgi:hypothetical protein
MHKRQRRYAKTLMHSDRLLRTDIRGRVRTPAKRREELVDEFERSGIAATKFAALAGIKYQTFACWVQRRKRQAGADHAAFAAGDSAAAPQGPRLTFVEAAPTPVAPMVSKPAGLRVHLEQGAQLEIADEQGVVLAAQLLRALGATYGRGRPC